LCTNLGGAIRILAFTTDGSTVGDNLAHCDEPARPTRTAPARSLPLLAPRAAWAGGGDPRAEPAPDHGFDLRVD
jgi:hypothetical protein